MHAALAPAPAEARSAWRRYPPRNTQFFFTTVFLNIPLSNYIGWFAVAALLHWLFQETIKKINFNFSLNLYLAQLIFFLALYVQSVL